MRVLQKCLGVLVGASILGCGNPTPPVASKSAPAVSVDTVAKPADGAAQGKEYVLSAEPANAKGVTDVRKASKDGDEVVVVGRIGGEVKPWVEGRASF